MKFFSFNDYVALFLIYFEVFLTPLNKIKEGMCLISFGVNFLVSQMNKGKGPFTFSCHGCSVSCK